jgi:hypothetical protein
MSDLRGAIGIDRRRSARKNHCFWFAGGNLCGGNRVRDDFAVHLRLADATGDELGILRAEIDY